MTEIEKYAVDLVGSGAESIAEDDMDEDGVFEDEADSQAAADLAVDMAQAIRGNPDSFLTWFRSVTDGPS